MTQTKSRSTKRTVIIRFQTKTGWAEQQKVVGPGADYGYEKDMDCVWISNGKQSHVVPRHLVLSVSVV